MQVNGYCYIVVFDRMDLFLNQNGRRHIFT